MQDRTFFRPGIAGDVQQLGLTDDLFPDFAMFFGAIFKDYLDGFLDEPGEQAARIIVDHRRFVVYLGKGLIQELPGQGTVVHHVVDIVEQLTGIGCIEGVDAFLLLVPEQVNECVRFHGEGLRNCPKYGALC